MSNPSNLYAEKIFAEHPIGLWPFDEEVDYISLIGNDHRIYTNWQPINSTISLATDDSAPFSPSVAEITTSTSAVGYYPFGASSPLLIPINKASLDTAKENINFGAHVKTESTSVISIAIGYAYVDSGTGQTVSQTKSFLVPQEQTWFFISETFLVDDIPEDNFYFILSAVAAHPVGVPTSINHTFFVDGLTVGQESEAYNYESLGLDASPSTNNVSGMDDHILISSSQYGITGKPGYYVIKDGTNLLAHNGGMPMVYGASNSTILLEDDETPGIIVPGYGLFNNSGHNKEYTIEAWLRIRSVATSAVKVMGPIGSDDGLYVDGPFLRLKVGNSSLSHYMGNMFRPLLINIKVFPNNISLMINGESVGTASIDSSGYPDKYDANGKDLDYIGFYAPQGIRSLEVDAVAIYSYSVPSLVAKRRFAYGQAVDLPETVNTAYGGSTLYFDYNFADYTNNYSYPSIGKWYQGYSDNFSLDKNIISSPDYALPEIFTQSGATYEEWIASQTEVVGKDRFVSFVNDPGYMYFEKLRMLKQDTRAAYIIFETQELSPDKQILMRIEDNLTQNYFEIYLQDEEVIYNLVYSNETTTLYAESGLIANTKSFAGIDIDGLAKYFGRDFSTFFGNKSRLSVYVGSDKAIENPFSGYIYAVNFCTDRNYQQISGLFQDAEIASTEFIADGGDSYFGTESSYWYKTFDGGLVDSFSLDAANTHVASYTLRPREIFGEVKLDIATNSYWQDYLPLKYFAQYVTSVEDPYYDLDFIQLNLGYSAPKLYSNGNYDTSSNPIKTYVTFQTNQSGAIQSIENFTNTQSFSVDGVVEPGDEWINTKYEVINGAIVYPPRSLNFEDISIVVHIEAISQGVLNDILKIKNLELSSQAYNSDTANPIGTRFGISAYPYRKYGLYYDYKSKNPYRIYKNSSPYLYLTSDNGIQKVGEIDPLVDRGIAIPVNPNISEQYKVVSMQASMLFPNTFESKTKILEIEAKNYYYRIYLEKIDSSGKRAKIYAVNASTGAINQGIGFYINGKVVREAVISSNEWFVLGMTFADVLDFDSFVGGVRITGPMLVNNLSHYQSTNLQEIQRQELRKWSEALSFDGVTFNAWSYWANTFIWNDVLIKSTTNIYGITPDLIYKTYVGTNKIIIDDNSVGINIENYEYPVYSSVEWSSSVVSPV